MIGEHGTVSGRVDHRSAEIIKKNDNDAHGSCCDVRMDTDRYFVRGVTSLARNMSRQQMLKAMEDWLPAGHLPNFYASGIGEVLSETRKEPMEPPPNVTCKNPKRLRGTVPEDLRQMLEEAEEEGNTHIVAWLPHGRAFKVYNKAAFSKTILPRYFKA